VDDIITNIEKQYNKPVAEKPFVEKAVVEKPEVVNIVKLFSFI
jgi:hypothetical protein